MNSLETAPTPQLERNKTASPEPMKQRPTEAPNGFECPRCKTAYDFDQKFCGECGERLWAECSVCGRTNDLHRKYCGGCGAYLCLATESQQAAFEEAWENARQLRENCRFDEALEIYRSLINDEGLAVRDLTASTQKLIRECAFERDQLQREAKEAGELAWQCLQRHEFLEAKELIEKLPRPMITEELRQTYREARQGLATIAKLKESLLTKSEAPFSIELLGQLAQLLNLLPDDTLGLDMAVRLRKELVRHVNGLLAANQYDAAMKLIFKTPAIMLDESTNELVDRVRELNWLAWDLRRSPSADMTLLAIADRFRKLSPKDEKVAEAYRALEARLRKAKESGETRVSWATPPERTLLGPPIRGFEKLERILVDSELAAAPFREQPGRFAVAVGLALQGLDVAPIRCNFVQKEESLLKKITSVKIGRKPNLAWGIDIGSQSLKAVRMRMDAKTSKAVVEAVVCVEHRKPLGHTGNEKEYFEVVGESLKPFLENQKLENSVVCLGVSAMKFVFRQFDLPAGDPSKIPPTVEFEAKRLFPLPLQDLAWDYLDFPSPHLTRSKKPQRAITLAGTRIQNLKSRLKSLAALGLKPDVVQCDAMALYNFAAFNFFPVAAEKAETATPDDPALALINLGSDSMNFVVCSPRMFWSRNFSIGADRLNRLLVSQFKLTLSQAEKWKREPTVSPDLGNLFETMQSGFSDLGQSILEGATAYRKAFPNQAINDYLIVGGGYLMHGLMRFLWFER